MIGEALNCLPILAPPLTLNRVRCSILELHGEEGKEPGDQFCMSGVIHVRTKPQVRPQVHIQHCSSRYS